MRCSRVDGAGASHPEVALVEVVASEDASRDRVEDGEEAGSQEQERRWCQQRRVHGVARETGCSGVIDRV